MRSLLLAAVLGLGALGLGGVTPHPARAEMPAPPYRPGYTAPQAYYAPGFRYYYYPGPGGSFYAEYQYYTDPGQPSVYPGYRYYYAPDYSNYYFPGYRYYYPAYRNAPLFRP